MKMTIQLFQRVALLFKLFVGSALILGVVTGNEAYAQ
jgi:hypothetical protein